MKTILVLTDFTEKGINAAEYAFHLATRTNADVLLFNAYTVPLPIGIENSLYYLQSVTKAFKDESTYQLEVQAAYLESLKGKFATHYPRISYCNERGNMADHFEKLLAENEVSLVVMGEESHRNFFERVYARDLPASIIEKATCPVLLLSANARFKPFKDVTFACGILDFTHLKAIDFVSEMISDFGAELDVVHISDMQCTEHTKAEESGYMQSVTAFKTFIDYSNLTWHKLKGTDLANILEKFSGFTEADMVCIIHKRHPFYDHIFHNNITRNLIGSHKKPILIFPKNFEHVADSSLTESSIANR